MSKSVRKAIEARESKRRKPVAVKPKAEPKSESSGTQGG
jgi:hypothetical protein